LQFHSTIRFGISLALAFIFLPIYLVISLIIFSPWWLALIIFLTIPVAGIFAWNYNILFRRIIVGFRLKKYIRENNPDYSDLRKNYDELIELVSAMKDNEK
jgi:ABC-type bacteriocin/lantibiotic exporter with double-glycine peptidase domain